MPGSRAVKRPQPPAAQPQSSLRFSTLVVQPAALDMRAARLTGLDGARRVRARPVEHEKADSGGQIALLAAAVDLGDRVRQSRVLTLCDLLQPLPELIFQTDACLVSADDNRALYDR